MDILIDTSVWIDFFNQKKTVPEVRLAQELLAKEHNNICICPLIYQEILQGIREEKIFADIKNILRNFSLLDIDIMTAADYAVDLYRYLRKKGITTRKSADCLIAAYAIISDVPLLHRDKDFNQIAKHSALEVYTG